MRVRLIAVAKALAVEASKRVASRCSAFVALHHGNRVQHLGGDRAAVGHAVLAGAAEFADAPAEVDGRQHHQHQDAQHLRHHDRVGDDQHRHRADAHHRVAQPHAQAGADDGLNQRGVGRQARQHLAGLRGLEELRALPDHVRVHRVAQVSRHPLAQPGDHVEAQRREQPERRAHAEQREEVLAHRHHALAGVAGHQALVDQRLERDREQQRAHRRHHQEEHRPRDAEAVRAQERQQPAERAHIARRRARVRCLKMRWRWPGLAGMRRWAMTSCECRGPPLKPPRKERPALRPHSRRRPE